jgi:protein phosphatase
MPSHYNPTLMTLDLAPGAGVDIVGDLHGCTGELICLLGKAGYEISSATDRKGFDISHPEGRRLFLVGDLTDRGPRNLDALRFVRDLIASGMGCSVIGNHDDKLLRALMGRKVKVGNGLKGTLSELDKTSQEERDELLAMLQSLPTQILLRQDGAREVLRAWRGARKAPAAAAEKQLRAIHLWLPQKGRRRRAHP